MGSLCSRSLRPGVALLACLLVVLITLAGCSTSSGSGRANGALAPDFSGTTLDGTQVSLSDYKGKPLVLNFMATWCGPCMDEAPEIDQFYRDNKDRVGFMALAVNDTADALRSVFDSEGWAFPVVFDGDRAASAYGVTAIPTTVVIDAEGRIVKRVVGGTTAADLSAAIDELTR